MPKRILPEKGTAQFSHCITAVQSFENGELEQFASKLGFSCAKSFLNAMRKEGYVRDRVAYGLEQELSHDVEIQKLREEKRHFQTLYRECMKRLAQRESVADSIKSVAKIIPAVTVVSNRIDILTDMARGRETDLLQVSDLHSGETVDLEETYGMNQFNMEILNRRLSTLFHKTLELVEIRRGSLNIPNLIISEQGDMLSGDIHDELVRTNIDEMMLIAVRTAFMLAQGVAYLSPHFEEIQVVCVPGNHARLQKRISFKKKYVNWDFLLYQWQAAFCRDLKNVKFTIAQSPFTIINAENTRLLIMHGDMIKSWMGVPWYGIERAALRLRDMLASAGDYYDAILLAHFHCRADIDKANGPIIINGSVKGGDEFSLGSYQTTNKPSQNLLHFHDKNGYLGGQPVYLASGDDKPDIEFKDFLTDNWADMVDEI